MLIHQIKKFFQKLRLVSLDFHSPILPLADIWKSSFQTTSSYFCFLFNSSPNMECALRYAIDNLRKSATCCICLGFFNRPVRLSCNHTYCEDCISPVLNAKKICPVCSSDIRRRYITCEVDCQSAIDKVSEFIALMEAAHPTLFKSACKAGNKRPHDTDPLESIIGSTDFPTEATTATTSTLHSTETPAFTVGDLVQVQMRTTAGKFPASVRFLLNAYVGLNVFFYNWLL